MVDDGTGGVATPTELSERTAEWLDERAAEHELSREEFVDRLIAAFRSVEADGEGVVSPSRVADLEARVEAAEEGFDELLRDVRERVVQVKRESDGKAPADHEHEHLDELADVVSELDASVEALREDFGSVDATVEEGFENVETVLEYLARTTDDIEEKSSLLARLLLDLRTASDRLTAAHGRRAATERLARAANELGIRTADCGDCGATLDVALLTAPRCPHCDATFGGVRPKRGFFGSPTLETGEPPALEAGTDAETSLLGPDSEEAVEALAEEGLDDDR